MHAAYRAVRAGGAHAHGDHPGAHARGNSCRPPSSKHKQARGHAEHHQKIGSEKIKVADCGEKRALLPLLDPHVKAKRIHAHRIEKAQQGHRAGAREHQPCNQAPGHGAARDGIKRTAAAQHEEKPAVPPLTSIKHGGLKAVNRACCHTGGQQGKHGQHGHAHLREGRPIMRPAPAQDQRRSHQRTEGRHHALHKVHLAAVDVKKGILKIQRDNAQHECGA